MSVSKLIKDQLKRKIQACASVQKVYGYAETKIEGFPAVFVRAADMDGEFSSTAENRRMYAYAVLILFPIGQDFIPPGSANRLEYAEDVVATVIDEIINSIDNDFELEGSPVLYVEATDVSWGEYDYDGGVAKAALMNIRVCTEHNVWTNQES